MSNKKKILVTATGGPTAIGVLKCLQHCDEYQIIGADARKDNPGASFCSRSFVIEKVSSSEYLNDISKIIEEESIDAIIPTMQDEIIIYHKACLKPYICIPESNHYDCLLDKSKLYDYIKTINSEVVPRYVVYKENDDLREIKRKHFANDDVICVKKLSGHGGIGFALLSDNRQTLVDALQNNTRIIPLDLYSDVNNSSKMIVMQYLDGIEYSVDILLIDGEMVACIPRKRTRVSTGIVIEGEVENNSTIIDITKKIAQELIQTGFINVQYIVSGDGIKLIDLNARFCGSQVHSFGAGANFPYLLLKAKLDGEINKPSINWNTKMIRYWESTFYHD